MIAILTVLPRSRPRLSCFRVGDEVGPRPGRCESCHV